MSDLSRLLDDVYRTTVDGIEPSWSSDRALDDAFADWVPGPPAGAPAAERAFAEDLPVVDQERPTDLTGAFDADTTSDSGSTSGLTLDFGAVVAEATRAYMTDLAAGSDTAEIQPALDGTDTRSFDDRACDPTIEIPATRTAVATETVATETVAPDTIVADTAVTDAVGDTTAADPTAGEEPQPLAVVPPRWEPADDDILPSGRRRFRLRRR